MPHGDDVVVSVRVFQRVGRANVNAETAKTAEHVVDLELRQHALAVNRAFLRFKRHTARRTDFDTGIAGDTKMVVCFFAHHERDRPFKAFDWDAFFRVDHGDWFFKEVTDRDRHSDHETPGAFDEVFKVLNHFRRKISGIVSQAL